MVSARRHRAAARELCPAARLRYVPNVVDVAAIAPVSPPRERAPRAVRGELRLRAQPQRPALPARGGLPAGLGASCPTRGWRSSAPGLEQPPSRRSARRDPRLRRGPRTTPTRARRCAVVPLLQGGGTPLKLIEALAYGLPVIATPRAAAGLDAARRRALPDRRRRARRSPRRSFASCATARRELGRRGRELAAERYSIEALSALLAPSQSHPAD